MYYIITSTHIPFGQAGCEGDLLSHEEMELLVSKHNNITAQCFPSIDAALEYNRSM